MEELYLLIILEVQYQQLGIRYGWTREETLWLILNYIRDTENAQKVYGVCND